MLEEFKNAFQRHNNGHIQLIIINVVIFAVLAVIYVFSTVSGFDSVFKAIHDQFLIPPRLAEFITRPWTLLTYGFAHSVTDIFHIL
ncbi:MAG TPA: rhomboid family intramembrane serine protease, partial [Cyclobacteriaceae bacterium]|nr:rhomboid family intramembrane serine protease [Cyclobacteriaceae bacterium]